MILPIPIWLTSPLTKGLQSPSNSCSKPPLPAKVCSDELVDRSTAKLSNVLNKNALKY